MTDPLASATILLTGGSRGVGAATTTALAARGATVIFTYREKATRAEEVAARAGGRAIAAQADLTVPADLDRLIATARSVAPRLTGLVLNASGGLEKERLAADPDFPLHLNRDAQLALLDRALRQLPEKPRQALLLSRVEGLTHAAIARRLGVSESMIAKYLAQSLRHCRNYLKQAEDEN